MFKILRWFPAAILMAIIFIASSTQSSELPYYGRFDWFIKKGGHVVGYGLLSIAYWYGFNFDFKKGWVALVLDVLYAASDELHQSFVPGRGATVIDVIFFDAVGAVLGLGFLGVWFQKHGHHLVNKVLG